MTDTVVEAGQQGHGPKCRQTQKKTLGRQGLHVLRAGPAVTNHRCRSDVMTLTDSNSPHPPDFHAAAMELSPIRRPYKAHALAHYPESRSWRSDFDPNAIVLVRASALLRRGPQQQERRTLALRPSNEHSRRTDSRYHSSPAQLCFPRGLHFKRHHDNRRIMFHTFVLTRDDGCRGEAAAVAALRSSPSAEPTPLTASLTPRPQCTAPTSSSTKR